MCKGKCKKEQVIDELLEACLRLQEQRDRAIGALKTAFEDRLPCPAIDIYNELKKEIRAEHDNFLK